MLDRSSQRRFSGVILKLATMREHRSQPDGILRRHCHLVQPVAHPFLTRSRQAREPRRGFSLEAVPVGFTGTKDPSVGTAMLRFQPDLVSGSRRSERRSAVATTALADTSPAEAIRRERQERFDLRSRLEDAAVWAGTKGDGYILRDSRFWRIAAAACSVKRKNPRGSSFS